MIEGIRNFCFERRLKLLKFHSLERRRIRGDLIEVFKWVKGFNKGKRFLRSVASIEQEVMDSNWKNFDLERDRQKLVCK